MTVFRLRIGFSLMCLFLFVSCCALGVWQLERYQYKKTLLLQYQEAAMEAPQDLSIVLANSKSPQFEHVVLTGEYLNELTVFLQNKIYKNKIGFEVLTPLKVAHENKWLLVDRGWVADIDSQAIGSTQGIQSITGRLKLLDEYQFILGKNVLDPNKRPLVMQKINLNELSQLTHHEYLPFILRLDASDKNGFVRDWPIMTIEPKRHLAYAIQWFLFALVLVVGYICFSVEKVNKS